MIKRNGRTALISERGMNEKLLQSCVSEHLAGAARLDRLNRYYKGRHDILSRTPKGEWAPNNRVVCNFPKYITDTVCGYVFGQPIVYDNLSADGETLELLRALDANTHDAELGKDLSVFGTGIELLYMTEDAKPALALLDPREAFVVYDDVVETKAAFGARLYPRHGEDGRAVKWTIEVFGEELALEYETDDLYGRAALRLVSVKEHYFGGVPMVEYWNNEEGMGDFEGVLGLVDAYNILTSDRVNDKERFVDAILLLVNAQLPNEESAAKMLASRVLEIPENSDARYITKAMNESQIQILADSIARDIHKFSQTPDMSDECFGGNSSGVAIKYKLLSLENLAKVKERFFIAGLRERLRLLSRILGVMGKTAFDPLTVRPEIRRGGEAG